MPEKEPTQPFNPEWGEARFGGSLPAPPGNLPTTNVVADQPVTPSVIPMHEWRARFYGERILPFQRKEAEFKDVLSGVRGIPAGKVSDPEIRRQPPEVVHQLEVEDGIPDYGHPTRGLDVNPIRVFELPSDQESVHKLMIETHGYPAAPYRKDVQSFRVDAPRTFGDLVKAHFHHDTPFGSWIRSFDERTSPAGIAQSIGKEFDAAEELGITGSLEDISWQLPDIVVNRLLNSSSRQEFNLILERFHAEERDRAVQGSFGFMANMAAGLLNAPFDPLTYVPVGFAAKGASVAGKAAVAATRTASQTAALTGRQFAKNIGKSMYLGSQAGFLGAGMSEMTVGLTQVSRSEQEQMMNVKFAALFGAGIGGAGRFLGDVRATQFYKDMGDDLRNSMAKDKAARLDRTTADDLVGDPDLAVLNATELEGAGQIILDFANSNRELFGLVKENLAEGDALYALNQVNKLIGRVSKAKGKGEDLNKALGPVTSAKLAKLFQDTKIKGRTAASNKAKRIQFLLDNAEEIIETLRKKANEAEEAVGRTLDDGDIVTVARQIDDLHIDPKSPAIPDATLLAARWIIQSADHGKAYAPKRVFLRDMEPGMQFEFQGRLMEVEALGDGGRIARQVMDEDGRPVGHVFTNRHKEMQEIIDEAHAKGEIDSKPSSEGIIYGPITEDMTKTRILRNGREEPPLAYADVRNGILRIDKERILAQYPEKPWASARRRAPGQLPPAKPDAIKSPEEFLQFVIEHEIAHRTNPRRQGESSALWENRVNRIALKKVQAHRRYIKLIDKPDLDEGPTPITIDNPSTLQYRQRRVYNDAGEKAMVQVDGKWAEKLGGIASPVVKLLGSTSVVARSVVEKLVVSPVHLVQQKLGIPLSRAVETLAGQREKMLDVAMNELNPHYKNWRKSSLYGGGKWDAFMQEVGKDMILGGKSKDASVSGAAKVFRRIYDRMNEDAKKYIKGYREVKNYFHRVYLGDRVDTQDFVDDLADVFMKQHPGGNGKAGMSRSTAIANAKAARHNILSIPEGLNPDLIFKRGGFKQRGLGELPPEFLLKYTDTNAQSVMRHYLRTLGSEIELTRAYGDGAMTKAMQDIEGEFLSLIDSALAKGDTALAKRLEKESAFTMSSIAKIRDDMRGLHNVPTNPRGAYHRVLPAFRKLGYMTQGGMFLLSNVVDITHAIGTFGLRRTFKDGWLKMFSDLRGYRMARDEARRFGEAVEAQRSRIVRDMYDLQHSTGSVSKLERGIDHGSELMSKLNGMQWWADQVQGVNGAITHTYVLEMSKKLVDGTISKRDLRQITRMGIGEDEARLIMNESKHFDVTERGSLIAKVDDWDSPIAKEVFANAIGVSGNLNRSLSGIGDKPFWTSSNIGRSLTQYMNFAFASTTRILISRLQARDLAALNASVAALSMGGLVYAAKKWVNDQPLPDSASEFTIGAIDQSGLTGWAFSADTLASRVSNGEISLNKLYDDGFQRRYYTPQDMLEAAIGPSGSIPGYLIEGLGGTMKSLVGDGRIDPDAVDQLRKTVPFQNLFYLQWLFSRMEE